MSAHDCPACRTAKRWTFAIVGALVLGILVFGTMSAFAQEPPPGERGVIHASDPAPYAAILAELAQHRELIWLSPARYSFTLDELESAREDVTLLTAKADAQVELIAALRGRVTALESEQAARVELETVLRRDLQAAEKAVFRSPPRRKLWAIVGFVAGGATVYAITR